MWRRARRILRDEEEAQDVMQEVFARSIGVLDDFDDDQALLRWMYRVTTNLSLNRLRRQRTHPVVASASAVEGIARGDEASVVDRAAVLQVLSSVDDATRQVAVYYYLDQMTMDEVAGVLGTTRKTVGRRVERFRKRARRLLRGAT